MSRSKKIMVAWASFVLAMTGFAVFAAVPAFATHVTTGWLADNAVTSAKIAEYTIEGRDLQTGAVGTRAISDFSIGGHDLGTGAVGTRAISDGSVQTVDLAADIQVESAVTRATGATGSFQNLAGDLTYEGAAGGISTYHAGIMGNFLGDALTNATSAYHAGVIGSYNVTTSDALTGAKAGLVGEAGTDVADAAVMAVLGGDTGTLTPTAAYGVQYFNSTAASKFDYGLDLSHAATTDYGAPSAVDYGVADIRLASGATISSGTTNPTAACVLGSLFLNTTDAKLYICTAVTPTWTVVGNQT
ncbi:MAG: hypothetical protein WDZ34_00255 [Candidatus Saccharimonadales bacterium]